MSKRKNQVSKKKGDQVEVTYLEVALCQEIANVLGGFPVREAYNHFIGFGSLQVPKEGGDQVEVPVKLLIDTINYMATKSINSVISVFPKLEQALKAYSQKQAGGSKGGEDGE